MQQHPDWYEEKRRAVEARFEGATAGREEEEGAPHSQLEVSPSGRFTLSIQRVSTGPQSWAYSQGTLRRAGEEAPIAIVRRNFGHFPFCFWEDHPSGRGFLLCGEDYQGQTLIDLATGERLDVVPEAMKDGFAFCWTAHYPSPDGRLLFVDGCVWAGPYEILVLDFERPFAPPWPVLARLPGLDGSVDKVLGFEAGAFVFEASIDVRKADGTPLSELDEAERDAVELAPNVRETLGGRRQRVELVLATREIVRSWIDPA